MSLEGLFAVVIPVHTPQCQVWGHLSVRDMARAAGACRQFAQRVQHARSTLRTLKVPAGARPSRTSCNQGPSAQLPACCRFPQACIQGCAQGNPVFVSA